MLKFIYKAICKGEQGSILVSSRNNERIFNMHYMWCFTINNEFATWLDYLFSYENWKRISFLKETQNRFADLKQQEKM